MKFKTWAGLTILSFAFWSCIYAYADEKKQKVSRPKLEAAVQRAFEKARSIEDRKLLRVSVITNEADDETKAVVFCEFGTGDVAMLQGGREPNEDAWIIIDKRNLDLMAEVVKRGQSR